MVEVKVKDCSLRSAATEGIDAFVSVLVNAIYEAVGGKLTVESMSELNVDQLTLLAYDTMHKEVMDGGFVQLIHNGYGGFLFLNPVGKMLKEWGIVDLGKLVYEAGHEYRKCHEEIERDCTDEEFMALFEQFPQFDDLDDRFVENEEKWTEQVAQYVDNNIDKFVSIEKT